MHIFLATYIKICGSFSINIKIYFEHIISILLITNSSEHHIGALYFRSGNSDFFVVGVVTLVGELRI